MRNPALGCAEDAGPQSRQRYLIFSENSRGKRQRLETLRTVDLWGTVTFLIFANSWVPLIPTRSLLLRQLVNIGFHR